MSRHIEDPLEQQACDDSQDMLEKVALANPEWVHMMHDWLTGKITEEEFNRRFEEWKRQRRAEEENME